MPGLEPAKRKGYLIPYNGKEEPTELSPLRARLPGRQRCLPASPFSARPMAELWSIS